MAQELTERLAAAFHFSLADLGANLRGRVTDRQIKFLQMQRRMLWTGFIVFFTAMVLTVCFFNWMSAKGGGADGDQSTVIISGLAGLIVLLFTPGFVNRLTTLDPSRFRSAAGKVSGSIRSGRYCLRFDSGASGALSLKFPAVEPYLSAFESGEEYLVFYLPGPAPAILSAKSVKENPQESIGGEGEHPAAGIARNAPLLMALLLAAAFGFPIVIIQFSELAAAWGFSRSAIELSGLLLGIFLAAIYLRVVFKIIRNGAGEPGQVNF